MPNASDEAHDLPVEYRLVSESIRKWLDRRFDTAVAANPDASSAFDQMRHLHLDDYWYTLVPEILDELRRAGKMG